MYCVNQEFLIKKVSCTDISEDFLACFSLLKDAERYAIFMHLAHIATALNKGERIDWKDISQRKYFIYYNFYLDVLQIDYTLDDTDKVPWTVYCLSERFLTVAITLIGRKNLANYFSKC